MFSTLNTLKALSFDYNNYGEQTRISLRERQLVAEFKMYQRGHVLFE